MYGCGLDIKFSRPFRNGVRFAVACNEVISSRVTALFELCSPAAIFGRVVTVVVNPVYRMFRRWSQAHVFTKSLKTIDPTFANCNASASIVTKVWCFRVSASLDDVFPSVILRRFVTSVAMKALQTSATFGSTHQQSVGTNRLSETAITDTYPFCAVSFVDESQVFDYQKAKSFFAQVFKVWMGIVKIWVGHVSNLLFDLAQEPGSGYSHFSARSIVTQRGLCCNG